MLKQRIITAILLAIVVIGTILLPDTLWLSLLLVIVLFVATREMLALCLNVPASAMVVGAAVFALFFGWSLTLVNPLLIYWQSILGLVIWSLITLGLFGYRFHGNWPLMARVMMLVLGLDLLWICAHGLIYLHYVYGGEVLLFLFSLVWIADIGAYFGGRKFGRHKLAPLISPGKTWEGVAGGLIANLLWMLLIYQFSAGWGLGLPEFLLIGLVTSLYSVVGDLFESVLKREAGVKDSGKLLPGHGGVLDRIDSIIAASPVFLAGVFLLGQA